MTRATSTDRSGSDGVEASRSEPCLLCGREHYCYLISDEWGETFKVLCHWTNPQSPPDGWQHIGTARDGRPIFVKQGYQRKRHSKKYPEVIELKPQAKTDIPQWQDVYIPVEQATKGHFVKLKPKVMANSETIYEFQKTKKGKRQGQGTIIAVLIPKGAAYDTNIEVPMSDIAEVLTYDPETGAKEQTIEYCYSDDFKIVRRQRTDRGQVYGGKSKEVRPYHRGTDGSWIKGKGGIQPPLYRQSEAEAVIRSGGIVIAVGGEQAVEYVRSLGLIAVCNQGGEAGYQQIAKDLAPAFAEARENELKPLLVIWADNDSTGKKTFIEGLSKECYEHGITSVTLDPLMLWSKMPNGGDAKDLIEYCRQEGICDRDIIRRLEFAIDEAIDRQEEEIRWRSQRQAWKAPVSHQGEIGRWQEDQQGNKYWQPFCNFDFQVVCELEDPLGGGLVLEVKRSFEQQQHRVILNSVDYTTVDKFEDRLKTELGTGIVCNLSKYQLKALIHTRVHEYRTNRQGKQYKRIDRYGQQSDGVWVFGDRQYTPDGKPTSENETRWVFYPNLGKEDQPSKGDLRTS